MTRTTATERRPDRGRTTPAGRRARRALLLVVLAIAGCDGGGGLAPGRVTVATTGGIASAQAIVGSWRRIVFFIDDLGYARSSETTWQFGADGSAARVQVARNYTVGLADVLVSAGRYRVEGTRVIIDLATPTTTQLAFEVRRTGNQLELAGQLYLLVTG